LTLVRALNDLALCSLPEYLVKPCDRHDAARDDICEGLTGPDRGQLIDIADEEHGRMVGHRLQQRIHQRHVDHGGLVDHEEITVERAFLIPAEAPCLGIEASVFAVLRLEHF